MSHHRQAAPVERERDSEGNYHPTTRKRGPVGVPWPRSEIAPQFFLNEPRHVRSLGTPVVATIVVVAVGAERRQRSLSHGPAPKRRLGASRVTASSESPMRVSHPRGHDRIVEINRDGPRRHDEWSTDMKRVRDSAFAHPPLTFMERLSRRRRYWAESGRYPHLLRTRECWTVRAEGHGVLVGYAWGYLVSDDYSWAYIDDVAVHVDQQARGVGRALIDEMVRWLGESGVEHVTGLATDQRMARIFSHHQITPNLPPEIAGDSDCG